MAFSETDGRRLAVEMLEELADVGADAANLDAGIRLQAGFKGGQRNVVGHYLAKIRAADSRELEGGFGAILSDLLAHAVEGGAEIEYYAERIDSKVAALRRQGA